METGYLPVINLKMLLKQGEDKVCPKCHYTRELKRIVHF